MDHPSPAGKQRQFSAFYPKSLRVRPGDTVVFDNQSTISIHTVSFGVKADRSNQPVPVTKGQVNQAVFAPCYQSSDPTQSMMACESSGSTAPAPGIDSVPPPPPAYAGQGYWSSGALVFAIPGMPSPPPADARRSTMKLADTVAPGSYHYVCLLHPFMEGTLEVVGDEADRASPDAVAKAGTAEYAIDAAAADKLPEPKGQTGPGRTVVVAGSSDKVTTVNAFFPSSVTVEEGDTVVWTDDGPYEPHTVTFNGTFKTPLDPGALVPGGVASGKDFPGGYAHSGLFGPPPEFPSTTFSLRFTKKGSYPYLCVLHPGMGGVVQVE
jgi:plastocyanin